MGHRSSIALALFAVPFAIACSSSDSGGGVATASDAGTTSDSALGADGAASQDSGVAADASTDSAVSNGLYSCAYSLSGARTDPTTDAPAACANGKVEQPSGAGDYTASFGGGFQTAAGDTVILTCTIASPTPPSAGSTWAMMKDDHAGGNCQLTVIANSQASSWIASGNAASLTGAASITFASATLSHGSAQPTDVYYTYDLTVDATLKAQAAGGADIVAHGHFVQTQLPLGN